ncbi:MAG: MFS transporter [Sphingobacteriales bacterium 17-39-43]|uniref:MFS transporter n=1 Tax=Daejeonella sp. TaxID=2805397 RepID=UPI000BD4BFBD|nr:MFS transporter [Daejeonella sp.]OYZ33124.1 MAG: MFS transporter [Sphingobacteriales bacterium 16-39-50]OZA26533.1 MAG: MFS transporter [Sphingobacteriales bacterium 17-39-43]OZA61665.1 MAG: MFS transporter [Sphingobacteriales bacterium 39-40-5]HQS50660.1 MFS transporter [Daejeonella sp.]HQT21685.1 MFS transporter [Daejeonella sp.]
MKQNPNDIQDTDQALADPTDFKYIIKQLVQIPVLVAALGYLVDMYDLFLFSVVRVPSLLSLGTSQEALLDDGIILLNLQMAGLLIGGIFWGILGDKKGRLSVLFGSILIYSLANIANGFVTSFEQYAVLRFIAGVGLAGELGAGITLVAEVLPRKIRGYGTTLVATMGVLGAVLAYFMADLFDWRTSYFIGGGLGLLLLVLRMKVFESGIFVKIKDKNIERGNVLMLFNNKKRFLKYLKCILIGLPIWFVVGILITFSPEFGKALGITEPVNAGKAVMFAFSGQVLGDLASGFLSQYFQSRKKIILTFMLISSLMAAVYLLFPTKDIVVFYAICALLGFANGYWTLFVTVAAEMFGTNLRATVATSVPNFVRGSVIPLTALFIQFKGSWGIIYAAAAVGLLSFVIAVIALRYLDETFHKDLNYVEED